MRDGGALGATVTAAGAAGKPKPRAAARAAARAGVVRALLQARARAREGALGAGSQGGRHGVTVKGWVRTLRRRTEHARVRRAQRRFVPGVDPDRRAQGRGGEQPQGRDRVRRDGASISVVGKVVKSQGGEQQVEVLATAVEGPRPRVRRRPAARSAPSSTRSPRRSTRRSTCARAHLRARAAALVRDAGCGGRWPSRPAGSSTIWGLCMCTHTSSPRPIARARAGSSR